MRRKEKINFESQKNDLTSPSFFDAIDDEITANDLGERFRQIRQSRGFTLATLSEKSSVSLNTLSLIENGKTSPSVSTLQQVARAMRISIVDFFQKPSLEKKIIFTPVDQGPKINLLCHQLEHLGKNYIHSAVQPFKTIIPPHTGSGSEEISHSGHEFVFCLSGEVEYFVSGQSYKLQTGSSLLFFSQLPHKWKNQSENEASLLLIFIPGCVKDMILLDHFNPIVQENEE